MGGEVNVAQAGVPVLLELRRLIFAADWGWGYGFFGFFGVVDGVAGALDGVVEIVFVDFDVDFVGGDFVQSFEEFLAARSH